MFTYFCAVVSTHPHHLLWWGSGCLLRPRDSATPYDQESHIHHRASYPGVFLCFFIYGLLASLEAKLDWAQKRMHEGQPAGRPSCNTKVPFVITETIRVYVFLCKRDCSSFGVRRWGSG